MSEGIERTEYSIAGQLAIGGELYPGSLLVSDGLIAETTFGPDAIASAESDYRAAIVAPGFIDLQVNGARGVEVDHDPDSIRTISEWLPSTGVTTWLPTVISSSPEIYPPVFAAFEKASTFSGADAAGLHLEGPFLSLEKKGAHDANIIEQASDDLIDLWLEHDSIQLVTVASERAGGLDRIRRLAEAGIVVSLGHTNGSYDDFVAGVDAGATMATHLYNAMSSFGHREPGVIGAALFDDRVTIGLIADGVHSHPAAVDIALRCKGPERIALVSDMMSAAGMPAGTYPLGGRDVTTDGISVRLPDGTLAGSVLTMDVAVRILVEWGVCDTVTAIQMATETPAKVMGWQDRGRLEAGRRADLTLLAKDLAVEATIVAGEVVHLKKNYSSPASHS